MTQWREDFSDQYLLEAPAALAFERILECEIYRNFTFVPPILDVGCGDGLFARLLFADPVDVGLDPDPDEIQAARQTHAYKELLCCFGDRIPQADASFNTVFSNSVLEHIEDLDPVLREIHRLLAPGGLFYLTIPTDRFERFALVSRVLSGIGLEGLSRRFARFYNRFWRHYHCYTPEQWTQRLTGIGFEVVTRREYASKTLCTLHDLLVVPALPALLSKKMGRGWIVAPAIRRLYVPWLARLGRWSRTVLEKPGEPGGLIFFCVRKGS